MRTGALGHDRIGAVVLSAIKRLVADIDKGALVTFGCLFLIPNS